MAYKFQVGPARLSGSTVFEEALSAASVTSVGASSAATLSASAGVSGGSLDIGGNADIDGELDVGGLFKMADVTAGKLLVADDTSYVEVALSGDATLASGGALTIADNAVTLAKMAGLARGSLILGDASGDPSALAKGSAAQFLQSDGTDPSYVSVSGDATVAAGGALTIADNAVSLAKMAGLARGSIIIGDASGDPSALAKGAASTFLQSDGTDTAYVAMSGDATLSAGALTIADNAVSLAKMAGLARGSIIIGDASGDPSALAKGGANTFLQSDGTDTSYVAMSGDATLSGGALTIADDAVESGMLNDNVISGQTELAAADIADADELMVSDGGVLKKVGVDSLATFIRGMSVQAIGDVAGTLAEGLNYGNAPISDNRVWTLPASPAVGDQVIVKAPEIGDNVAIVVTRAGSQLIDGSLETVSLEEDGSSVTLVYVTAGGGGRWVIV